MVPLTSASGPLALLDEEREELRVYALQKLNEIVNDFWAEIADSVEKIEVLYEDDTFSARELAALVASKVYYHLGEFSEAMSYALSAGKLFDVTQHTEYVETLVARCIEEYITLQQADQRQSKPIDTRLEAIISGMFMRCFKESRFKQALGIAFECRRVDLVRESIMQASDVPDMLDFAFKTLDLITNREFRHAALRELVEGYRSLAKPDYISMCRCLIFLDDASAIFSILDGFAQSTNEDDVLLAYQIAFDTNANATQQFLFRLRNALPKQPVSPNGESSSRNAEKTDSEGMQVDATEENDDYPSRLKRIDRILSGVETIGLNLAFLYRNNHTDMMILKQTKDAVEPRNSIAHNATVFANAVMHCGTTIDTFLRENLDWMGRATNWNKFSATAALGVIHKGHIKESLTVLDPYLPRPGQSGSPYQEGGALYALGLIHANQGERVMKHLSDALKNAGNNEVVQHGACLGLGVAAMATADDTIYEELKGILYLDDAVASEAAGVAMGLVMLGSASQKALDEMLPYAHDTKHEKIIRGLAMGMALIMYGREEEADTLIEQLLRDKDAVLRYGGMYVIGMAYSGTGNDGAIRRLLHVAVSDVSDDVRRAATANLGFVLSRNPEKCPEVVQLLAESYNPHVRYGAALALGTACAGTGMYSAVELLETMTADPIDYVRQGALIALGMVLMQTTAAQLPKVTEIIKHFEERIKDKHERIMSKFGAIIATGIMNAGGRNVTISLHSESGHNNMLAIVGVALFTQFWYWFPLSNFLSLAFTPTTVIALNKNLKMPKMQIKSNARPSLFAYPPDIKPPAAAAPKKVTTAELSITRKAKARKKKEQAKEAKEGKEGKADKMDTDETASKKVQAQDKSVASGAAGAKGGAAGGTAAMEVAATATEGKADADKDKEKSKPAEPEATFEIKENPARVTKTQRRFISFDVEQRYVPLSRQVFGITMVKDLQPSQPEELVEISPKLEGAADDAGDEPPPPQPFEWKDE